jgi:hypothetical protein
VLVVCVKRIDVAVFSCVYFNCEVLGRSESLYFEVKISFSSVHLGLGLGARVTPTAKPLVSGYYTTGVAVGFGLLVVRLVSRYCGASRPVIGAVVVARNGVSCD